MTPPRPSHRLATLLVLLSALCPACTSIVHDYDGPREMTPGTRLTVPSTKIAEIRGEKKAFYLFFGLIPLNNGSGPQLADDVVVEYLGEEAVGVSQLEIYEGFTTWDVIRNLLVGPLIATRTVSIQGQGHVRPDDPRLLNARRGGDR